MGTLIFRVLSSATLLIAVFAGSGVTTGSASADVRLEMARDRSYLSFHAGVNNGTTGPNSPLPTVVTVVAGSEVEIFGYIRSLLGERLTFSTRDKVEVQTRGVSGSWTFFSGAEMDPRFGTGKIYFSAKPQETTLFRFVVTPVCMETTPSREECRVLRSNAVELRVAGGTRGFDSFVGTYREAFRGESVNLSGNLYLRTSQSREPAIDVPVTLEQLTGKGWKKVGATRTTIAGTFSYDIDAKRSTTFRWKFGGMSSEHVQLRVIEPDANRLSVSWPPFINVFSDFAVSATIINSRGDAWQGSATILLQYRPSRASSWVTISRESWSGESDARLSAKTQGVGYYRVSVPGFGMESQAFYG